MKIPKNRGINLIEIIIVISIIAILSAIVMPNLSKFRQQQALKNTTADIVSILNKARNDTISSKNSTTYGIHFEEDSVILFTGSSYGSSIVVEQIDFDSTVNIPASGGLNLNGGGSDVIFSRITGDTLEYGTIVVQLISDSSKQKIITINQTGVISAN